ncbi:aromatic amino acid lyase [Streptomyces sp. NPDC058734]|uniref:aromatic amino acid lyase n=1 Tax=Streptomyces sp. NPDC058734 TaxID=3346615 RepID=UPI00368A1AC7
MERPAAEALHDHGLEPVRLRAKEALTLVNGTSFMAAYAVLAHAEAGLPAEVAELCTAWTTELRLGPAEQFSPFPHLHKPHPGQAASAAAIRRHLAGSHLTQQPTDRPPSATRPTTPGCIALDRHVQDPYSLRCAPHVVGVLRDTLEWTGRWLAVEVNSSNDDPLFDTDIDTVARLLLSGTLSPAASATRSSARSEFQAGGGSETVIGADA